MSLDGTSVWYPGWMLVIRRQRSLNIQGVTARAFCAVSFTARPARKTRNWIHAAPAN